MLKYRLVWQMSAVTNGMTSYQLKLLDRDSNDELWSMSAAPTRVGLFRQGTIKRPPGLAT